MIDWEIVFRSLDGLELRERQTLALGKLPPREIPRAFLSMLPPMFGAALDERIGRMPTSYRRYVMFDYVIWPGATVSARATYEEVPEPPPPTRANVLQNLSDADLAAEVRRRIKEGEKTGVRFADLVDPLMVAEGRALDAIAMVRFGEKRDHAYTENGECFAETDEEFRARLLKR